MIKKHFKWVRRLFGSADGIVALVFGMMFLAAINSIARGAWWHIFTAAMSFAIWCILAAELIESEEDGE